MVMVDRTYKILATGARQRYATGRTVLISARDTGFTSCVGGGVLDRC